MSKTTRLTQKKLNALVRGFNAPGWAETAMSDIEQDAESRKSNPGMRLCILASGSDGNCLCVTSGNTRVLVDAGIKNTRLTDGLAKIRIDPKAISAVLVTHEHAAHLGLAALTLHRQHGVPLYASEGTAAAVARSIGTETILWQIFKTGEKFRLGDLMIDSFSVSHKAADPVGFVIDDGRSRLGIATDLGMATATVRRKLSDCDALVLDTNHDIEMLNQSGYPKYLIKRIQGRRGHLSNEQTAALLTQVITLRLKTVVLAHLNRDCNTLPLALAAVMQALERAGRTDVHIEIAGGEASGFIELSGVAPIDAQPGT
jgi:phosphoribosyl 1,2-cyclic phosphodiesterase